MQATALILNLTGHIIIVVVAVAVVVVVVVAETCNTLFYDVPVFNKLLLCLEITVTLFHCMLYTFTNLYYSLTVFSD
jgi:hypothetical protein